MYCKYNTSQREHLCIITRISFILRIIYTYIFDIAEVLSEILYSWRRCLSRISDGKIGATRIRSVRSERGANTRVAVILTNIIIRPIIRMRNDRPRPRSQGQLRRFLGPRRLAQRDRIASLLLVRWYMSSLCTPYCVNHILVIYMVGLGSTSVPPV